MRSWIVAAAVVVTVLAPAVEARANCAAPVAYGIEETAPGLVRVCLHNFDERRCPDQGLLRRAADGSSVVELTRCDEDGCFLDECVPAGTYEYGLAAPYACHGSSCSTEYYGRVTVAGPAGACVRTGDAPVAATGVPWESGRPIVCGYAHGEEGGCSTGAAAVLGTNLAVLLAGLAFWRRRGVRRPRA